MGPPCNTLDFKYSKDLYRFQNEVDFAKIDKCEIEQNEKKILKGLCGLHVYRKEDRLHRSNTRMFLFVLLMERGA